MTDDSALVRRFPRPRALGTQLDSWKQIAGYLKRHETTVRRWETHEGLPVHRHFHAKLGSIYAYTGELDAWLDTRQPGEPLFSGIRPSVVGAAGPFEQRPSPAVLPVWPGPFLHRETELDTLARTWEVSRAGRSQLVLITGDAGIGKTRLVTEFARSVADHAMVITGRGELEAIVPFAPFIAVFQGLVRRTAPPALRHMLKHVEGSAELVRLLPDLVKHVRPPHAPMGTSPDGHRYRLFDALAATLTATAQRQTVLVLLDDMQWADDASLVLLRHLVRSTPAAPILFVVTYRQAGLDNATVGGEILHELWREPSATRLTLKGLPGDHVGDLIRATIGPDTPCGVTSAITAQAGGNPLFIIELARHLTEAPVPSGAVDLPVPDTIRELLDRRVRRLGDTTRQVLAVAAIIGRDFEIAVLEGLECLSAKDVLNALDEAVEATILEEDPRSPGHFSFTHALLREVVYRRMTATRRIRLHHQIAQVIERQSVGQLPLGDLAYHFSQAASFRDAEKATTYATRAGDQALTAGALEHAAHYYEMALRSLAHARVGDHRPSRQAELQRKRGRSYAQAGLWASAKEAFESALALLPATDETIRGDVLVSLAEASFWLMNVADVQRFAEQAYALADRLGRHLLAADALAWLASAKVSDGDVAGGIALDRQALARAGGVRSFGLARAPLTLYWAGKGAEAVDAATQGVERARAAEDPAFLLYALQHLGLSLCSVGRYDASLQAFDEACALGHRSGALPLLARAMSMSVAPWLSLGDLETAATRAHEARALARRVSFEPPLVSAGIDLLIILARQHQPDSADALLDEIDQAARAARGWHAWKWRLRLSHARSELAMARGHWADALHEADHVVEQSRPRIRLKYEALGLATRATAERHLRRKGAAAVAAQAAIEVARRLGDPAVLLYCLTVQLEIDSRDALRSEARATVRRMLTSVSDDRLRRTFLSSVHPHIGMM